MSKAMEIEANIRELVDQARAELSGSPVHIDTDSLAGLAAEINELQQKIWEIES